MQLAIGLRPNSAIMRTHHASYIQSKILTRSSRELKSSLCEAQFATPEHNKVDLYLRLREHGTNDAHTRSVASSSSPALSSGSVHSGCSVRGPPAMRLPSVARMPVLPTPSHRGSSDDCGTSAALMASLARTGIAPRLNGSKTRAAAPPRLL